MAAINWPMVGLMVDEVEKHLRNTATIQWVTPPYEEGPPPEDVPMIVFGATPASTRAWVEQELDLTQLVDVPVGPEGFTVAELRSLLTLAERRDMDAALEQEENTDLLLKVKLAELSNARIDPQSELFLELLQALVAFDVISLNKMALLLDAFGLTPPEG